MQRGRTGHGWRWDDDAQDRGSSTVYPVTSDGSSVWNSNPSASDAEYWGPGRYGISTDQPMAVYEAGVTQLTGDQIAAIHQGEITDWSQIDAYSGPGKEIQAVGCSEGSGTDTAFRAYLLGDPDAPMPGADVRKGQNQQVTTLVSNSDNTIACLALAFVDPDGAVPPIGVTLDGTTYEYGENPGAKSCPLSRDLHCYTYEGASRKEVAFVDVLLSEYGQQNFVAANDYFVLPLDRRRAQCQKLPDQD